MTELHKCAFHKVKQLVIQGNGSGTEEYLNHWFDTQ